MRKVRVTIRPAPAFAARSAVGRSAKKTDGFVTADTNGTRSIVGAFAPPAYTSERGEFKHRGIDVRGDDLCLRDRSVHRPSDDTSPRTSLKNAVWLEKGAALRDNLRIRLEQEAHVAVIKCGS